MRQHELKMSGLYGGSGHQAFDAKKHSSDVLKDALLAGGLSGSLSGLSGGLGSPDSSKRLRLSDDNSDIAEDKDEGSLDNASTKEDTPLALATGRSI